MVEHSQPDGLVSRYEYDRYDTDGKVLKSSNNLGEEWTFDYRKDQTVVTDALARTADIPISTPIPTVTNPWHRSTTGPTKKVKATNKPTTSTATKIGFPKEIADKNYNLVWFANYTVWSRLKEETKVTDSAYHPFRLQNQYYDSETGLHYNFFRYYKPDAGRSVMSGQAAGHIVASGGKVNRWEPAIESRQITILILMVLLMESLLVILALIMKCIIENFMKRYEID